MLSGKVVRTMAENYPEKLKIVTRKFLPDAAFVVESAAKRNAPIDTGLLRARIMSDVRGDDAVISSMVKYSAYIEYGTKRMKAQPFMRPALDKNRMKLTVLFRKIMGQVYGR